MGTNHDYIWVKITHYGRAYAKWPSVAHRAILTDALISWMGEDGVDWADGTPYPFAGIVLRAIERVEGNADTYPGWIVERGHWR